MIWPPQNTGVFAISGCLPCCTVPCVRSFDDSPPLAASYSQVTNGNDHDMTVALADMGIFLRFTFTFTGFANLDRYFLKTDFTYDPVTCGNIGAMSNQWRWRIFSRTSAIAINWYPMILQGGHYFIDQFGPTAIAMNTVSGSFTSSPRSPNASDPWNRYDPTDGSPNAGVHPDFSAAGAPINFGFRFNALALGAVETVVLDVARYANSF